MSERYALGVDVGGTFIKYGLCSDRGDIIQQSKVPTLARAPREDVLNQIKNIIEEARRWAKEKNIRMEAVGIGTPGSVDVEKGFLKGGTPNFAHWHDVPIVEYLAPHFSFPIFADNDANMMTYGEFKFGAGRGKRDVITLTLGTGIGGGIIIDGELYRGHFYAGAELGHMSIDYRGRHCRCGGIGCWELYASATAMIRDYNKRNREHPVTDTRDIFRRYHDGEAVAATVIDRTVMYLGAGLANIINVFNPEMIIIGGGVSEAGEWFIDKAAASAFGRAMPASRENVIIRKAQLGNQAGMLGAAAFALTMAAKSGIGE